MATDKGSGAIPGLRKQILDNATVLYAKIVEEYQEAVRNPSVKPSEVFKITTVEDMSMEIRNRENPDMPLRYYGIRVNLLFSPGPGAAPERLIEGPRAGDRSDALEGLLKATEHCLGAHEDEITPLLQDVGKGIDVSRDSGREMEAHFDDGLLYENVSHARDRLD